MNAYTSRRLLVAAVVACTLTGSIKTPVWSDPVPVYGTGCDFDTKDEIAQYPRLLADRSVDTDRPSQLLLTNFLPPVANQGNTGSCVGWSTAYYCMTYSVARHYGLSSDQINNPKFLFSPNFLWDQYNQGNRARGMRITDAFNILSNEGCATLDEMPWDSSGKSAPPTDPDVVSHEQKYKARRILNLLDHYQLDPEKLKTVLWETKEPVVIGIKVFNDLFTVPNSPDFVYTPSPSAGSIGGHAICIIGYDETKDAFRMVNSWGPSWGDHGFLWLSADYVAADTNEAWAQDPGGPRARDIGSKVEKLIQFKSLSVAPPDTDSHLRSR